MKCYMVVPALILFFTACSPEAEYYPDAICIEDITTSDAENGLQEHQTVIIHQGEIVKIGHSNSIRLSPDNKIIDGTGKYLTPGLWDAHVHFAFIEELAPYMFDLFLYYGITSVRDTGGEIHFMRQWKEASEQNTTTAPRVMIAGPLLDGMPNVYDGSIPARPPLSKGLATVEDVENYIDYLDSLGVDLLKAYEMLTPPQFMAVMAKAKEKGLRVTGHVPLSMDVISTAEAGLNSIEHLRNVEMSMAVNADQLLKRRQAMLEAGKNQPGGDLRASIHQRQRLGAIANPDSANTADVIAALNQNQVVQIPTLALSKVTAYKEFTGQLWQESYALLPDTIESGWHQLMLQYANGPENTSRQKHYEWASNMTGKMHKAGIPFMAGTDTPIGFLTPGRSLHEELALYVEAGMTPLEAIESATLEPAKYFHLDHELGLISEGMIADLLILEANPLEDIRNTESINSVIKEGYWLSPEKLAALKNRLKSQ